MVAGLLMTSTFKTVATAASGSRSLLHVLYEDHFRLQFLIHQIFVFNLLKYGNRSLSCGKKLVAHFLCHYVNAFFDQF